MNKPYTAAEKAATVIWDHNFGAWCGLNARQMTPIIQAAIDEAGAEQQARIDVLVEALRTVLLITQAQHEDALADIKEYVETALAPLEKQAVTRTVPAGDWPAKLCETLLLSKPGDFIQVDSEARLDLAVRAIEQLGVPGVTVEVEEPKPVEKGGDANA